MPEKTLGPSDKKYDPFGRSKYINAYSVDGDKVEDWDNELMAPEETHHFPRCYGPVIGDTYNPDARTAVDADVTEV